MKTTKLLAALGYVVLLGVPALVLGASACSNSVSDLCDQLCECELCNDDRYDDCIREIEESVAIAEAYECGDELSAMEECFLDKNTCDDGSFSIEDDCSGDSEELSECIADASDLIGEPPDNSSGQSTGNGGGNEQLCFDSCISEGFSESECAEFCATG